MRAQVFLAHNLNKTVNIGVMRRHPRPQQEIYRPGSGPLRKSASESCSFDDDDIIRRSRKPEQEYYVAGGRNRDHFNNGHMNKRYTARHRQFDSSDWQSRSSQGRRYHHQSTPLYKDLDNLAPRFRKKILEEQRQQQEQQARQRDCVTFSQPQPRSVSPCRSVDEPEPIVQNAVFVRCSKVVDPVVEPPPIQVVAAPSVNTPDVPVALNWGEEVELNDKLQAAAQNAEITRSASLVSLSETVPKNANASIRRQKSTRKQSNRRSRHHSECDPRSPSPMARSTFNMNRLTIRDRSDAHEPKAMPERIKSPVPLMSLKPIPPPTQNVGPTRQRDLTNSVPVPAETSNWRDEIRQRQELTNCKKGGLLVLPVPSAIKMEQPRYHNVHRDPNAHNSPSAKTNNAIPLFPEVLRPKKSLFDPNNPNKPIIVKTSNSTRASCPVREPASGTSVSSSSAATSLPQDQFGNARPTWYDESSKSFQNSRYQLLLCDIKLADHDLQVFCQSGMVTGEWTTVEQLRTFLKDSLRFLLSNDLKFCEKENIEQHFWRLLYHNMIELVRRGLLAPNFDREQCKKFTLHIIDDGCKLFEELLDLLEKRYNVQLERFMVSCSVSEEERRQNPMTTLVLVSAQKFYLFLGDLSRYREQENESNNFGKCRQWYIKAHEINPKNGKPYNQLAVLAVNARRKLDAVYYYMRSLMSSNPVPSAKENLISLFDENRKKYESAERKRREERADRRRQQMKLKESEGSNHSSGRGAIRHETWILPGCGKHFHRTTQAIKEDSDEDELAELSSAEVNKRFVISYLHVQGKLITRIGMESFHETALQMLKEFRVLLQDSPLPLPSNRFLQLLALNMYAIESTKLKETSEQFMELANTGYRSELQERALVISLQMFNLILERCLSFFDTCDVVNGLLVNGEGDHNIIGHLPEDVLTLLPAVKIWCDWMLCHHSIWNPPPSMQDFASACDKPTPEKMLSCSRTDCWTRLAHITNTLERLYEYSTIEDSISSIKKPGYVMAVLPEDGVLCGFTPLLINESEPAYVPADSDMETVYFWLRIKQLLFFGREFLCGLEPPVLKLEIENDVVHEYVSVVCVSNPDTPPPSTSQLTLEQLSDNSSGVNSGSSECEEEVDGHIEHNDKDMHHVSSVVQNLLSRKVELEKTDRKQQLHRKRVKKILSEAVVTVHITVKPRFLVPDTNCFIDHLNELIKIANSNTYILMVPIIVLSELEGLSRGGKFPMPPRRRFLDPDHVLKVAEAASAALSFLKSKPTGVKCITSRGTILQSATFTTEDENWDITNLITNDDRILVACLALANLRAINEHTSPEHFKWFPTASDTRNLGTETVLLTDDRNLRVKALSRDLPVRELLDFIKWAGLD